MQTMNQTTTQLPSSRRTALARNFHPPVALRIQRARALSIAALLWFAPLALAQTADAGTIEGRVQNVSNGTYLNNARVTVVGTDLETLTDRFGQYRLSNVPTGETTLRVYYTGLTEGKATLTVPPRGLVQRDFSLGILGRVDESKLPTDIVKLDPFVIGEQKQMTGSAIAINEQRFAANLKTVVASDEFGNVSEGNVGEFAKFLPGVSVNRLAADVISFTVRGLPTQYTAVSADGNGMASGNSSNPGRQFETEQLSINNIARFELTMSPTPDTRADALGGSINLISKSAFERSKAAFNFSAYVTGRDNGPDRLFSLSKSPGPTRHDSHQTKPNADFTWIVPLNNRFGFTLTGLQSNVTQPFGAYTRTWIPDGLAVPAGYTNPGARGPYLARYAAIDGPKDTTRTSFGLTTDFRITPNDILSLRTQYTYYDAQFINQNLNFDVGAGATSWGPAFTQGAVGAGIVSFNPNQQGRKAGGTFNPSFSYRHNGPTWKIEANGAHSHASNQYANMLKGFFETNSIRMTGVTVRFDDIQATGRPNFSVTDARGNPVDYTNLNNYRVNTVTNRQRHTLSDVNSANASAQRNFAFKIPFSLKAGVDVRQTKFDVEHLSNGTGTYIGPDGIANTADDSAGQFVDDRFSTRVPGYGFFGLPRMQWPSNYKLRDMYVEHPGYFRWDDVTEWRNIVNNSLKIKETISSVYLRGDARLLQNRLTLVGGVRMEHTNSEGEGPLVDNTALYRKGPNGALLRDAANRPILVTTDPLAQTKLAYLYHGAHRERSYRDYYPSLNGAFNFTDKLVGRFAYARTLGRPDYTNIIPGLTVPDPGSTSTTITVKNTELVPWTANSYDLSLEYYFQSTGVLSLGLFRKDISNFFGSVTTPATPELLAQYDLDQTTYRDYFIATSLNAGSGRVSGISANYKQALLFLPHWARGIQVFGNFTTLKLEGSNQADFGSFIPHTANWGLSFTRPKLTLKVNFNLAGGPRPTLLTGAGVPPETYSRRNTDIYIDTDFEYRFYKGYAVFLAARNAGGVIQTTMRYGPTTPDYARQNIKTEYGRLFTLGIKGSF